MKNAKELREITNSQRKILFEKAKQIIFKDIEFSYIFVCEYLIVSNIHILIYTIKQIFY